MGSPRVRGVAAADEARAGNIRRDARRLGQQVFDAFRSPPGAAGTMLFLAAVGILVPGLAHFTWIVAAVAVLTHLPHARHRHLPMRLPVAAGIRDRNDPLPGRRAFRKAAGIIHIGNAVEFENQELWSSRTDELAHGLMIGTTGAGKSVALIGMSANYIGIGGGLIYADAKASPTLAWDIAAIAFRCGREDDLLVINYMTGNRTVTGVSSTRTSNTANPFTSGSADSCVQMLSSLIKEPEGDNAVFGERALSMITATLYGLVALRDAGHIDLGVGTIRDALTLDRLEQICQDPRIAYRPVAREAIRQYLLSLPNYKPPDKRIKMEPRSNPPRPMFGPDGEPVLEPIAEQATTQHGYAQMYFTRAMSSLTDTYGHIYRGNLPEVDFVDVVRRRRILVVMLPSLEKSPAELSNLGKINLAALRDAISTGLGSGIEGRRRDVLENLPTDSPIPSKIVLDEYGYMAVDGFSIVAAQARSLGFSCIWAGQDWAGIKRGSEREAEQIWSNATCKIFGRLEDAEAFQKLKTALGEVRIAQIPSYARDGDAFSYRESQELSLEKTDRADFTDLQEQIEGEAHIAWRGTLMRTRMFYADVPELEAYRVNRYLRVGEKTVLNVAPVQPARAAATASGDGDGGGHANRPIPPPRRPVDTPPPAVRPDAPRRRPPPAAGSLSMLDELDGFSAAPATPPGPPPPIPPAARPPRRNPNTLTDALQAASQPDPVADSEDEGPPVDDGWTLPAPPRAEAPSQPPPPAAAPTALPAAPSPVDLSADLPESLDLMELFAEGSAGYAELSQIVGETIERYPEAQTREAAAHLSADLVLARLDASMRTLLDGTADPDDDVDSPST
jgi:intracellular multiplication protein IcmO